jgi:hypothetical protein
MLLVRQAPLAMFAPPVEPRGGAATALVVSESETQVTGRAVNKYALEILLTVPALESMRQYSHRNGYRAHSERASQGAYEKGGTPAYQRS